MIAIPMSVDFFVITSWLYGAAGSVFRARPAALLVFLAAAAGTRVVRLHLRPDADRLHLRLGLGHRRGRSGLLRARLCRGILLASQRDAARVEGRETAVRLLVGGHIRVACQLPERIFRLRLRHTRRGAAAAQ